MRSVRHGFRCLVAGVVAVPCVATAGVVAGASSAAAVSDCGANGITVTSINPPVFYVGSSDSAMAGYAGYRVSTSAARTDLWVGLSSFTGGVLNLAPSQPASQPIGNLAANATAPTYFLLTASAASSVAQSHVVTVYQGKPGTAGASELCTSTGSFSAVSDTISASANKIVDVTGDGASVTVSTSSPHLGSTLSVTVEGQTGTLGNATGDPYGFYMTPAAYASWPAGAFRLTTHPGGDLPGRDERALDHRKRASPGADE